MVILNAKTAFCWLSGISTLSYLCMALLLAVQHILLTLKGKVSRLLKAIKSPLICHQGCHSLEITL